MDGKGWVGRGGEGEGIDAFGSVKGFFGKGRGGKVKTWFFVVEICEDKGLWHGWNVEVLGRRPQVLCSGNYYRLGVYIRRWTFICCWTQPYQPYEAEVTNSPISNICSISSNTAGGMGVFFAKGVPGWVNCSDYHFGNRWTRFEYPERR